LLQEFRDRYHAFGRRIEQLATTATDSVVVARLGDDLRAFTRLVEEHQRIFNPHEYTVLRDSLGRPKLVIDRQWLAWAYGHQSIAKIARFLGVHRSTVRTALIEYGLATPQENVFAHHRRAQHFQSADSEDAEDDENYEDDEDEGPGLDGPCVTSYTRPFTSIGDDDLDAAVRNILQRFPNAGVIMMRGYLRAMGIDISKERVRQSLLRVNPVERIFERVRIERRKYQVAGPNALWHHDGQHGISVHNVRIERLWVDVKTQVLSQWQTFFANLEIHHGFNVNNMDHILLLHYLFLPQINNDLAFFASGWNHHKVSGTGGRTPSEMFGWDMYVHGVRGYQLAPLADDVPLEDLEDYGIDFRGLRDPQLLLSRNSNNPMDEGTSTFLGRIPRPEHMNTVEVETDEV
ncbi:hypothetical protein K474DRAFT_1562219, partial [Panus rudis PR-1116 ss-1]